MKKCGQQLWMTGLVILFAIAGALLRLWQLRSAPDGLWTIATPQSLAIAAAAAVVIVVLAVLSSRLSQRPEYQKNFPAQFSIGAGYVVGGMVLVAACIVVALTQNGLPLYLSVAGGLCGVLVGVHGVMRMRGATPGLLTGCLPVLWLVLRIIADFKNWSNDPAILDYCFELFALLCSMLACFHVAGFSANRGKRRISLFWSMTAVFFCAVSMADGEAENILVYSAFLLIGLQNVWCLSRTEVPQQNS